MFPYAHPKNTKPFLFLRLINNSIEFGVKFIIGLYENSGKSLVGYSISILISLIFLFFIFDFAIIFSPISLLCKSSLI